MDGWMDGWMDGLRGEGNSTHSRLMIKISHSGHPHTLAHSLTVTLRLTQKTGMEGWRWRAAGSLKQCNQSIKCLRFLLLSKWANSGHSDTQLVYMEREGELEEFKQLVPTRGFRARVVVERGQDGIDILSRHDLLVAIQQRL
jgi:hypothetical protein